MRQKVYDNPKKACILLDGKNFDWLQKQAAKMADSAEGKGHVSKYMNKLIDQLRQAQEKKAAKT